MDELHKAKKLPVHGLGWSDSGSPAERKAIMRMEFIFLTYHPNVWWFEIVVMMQKLLFQDQARAVRTAPKSKN